MLERTDTLEEQRKVRQAGMDSGLARNLAGRHIEVQIYGTSTAVATNYVVGNLTPPGGKPQQILRRRTAVLVKQGGKWKIVHRHISSLNSQ
jgi:ketosteroid isomerase-like protein